MLTLLRSHRPSWVEPHTSEPALATAWGVRPDETLGEWVIRQESSAERLASQRDPAPRPLVVVMPAQVVPEEIARRHVKAGAELQPLLLELRQMILLELKWLGGGHDAGRGTEPLLRPAKTS